LLQQRLVFGAYPEVVLTPNPVRLLHEFSADYLWKDVLQTGLIKTPDLIKRLLLLLAHQISSEVSVNELATQLGMARPVVERYLDLLEQTFVIFRLPSFSTNPHKEIAKGRKVFFGTLESATPSSMPLRPKNCARTSVFYGKTGRLRKSPNEMPCSVRRRNSFSGTHAPNRKWIWS